MAYRYEYHHNRSRIHRDDMKKIEFVRLDDRMHRNNVSNVFMDIVAFGLAWGGIATAAYFGVKAWLGG